MKQVFLLTDYMNHFGSKANDFPYRSGMDLKKLKTHFELNGFEAVFLNFSQAQNTHIPSGAPVLYTSSEDPGYVYKSYIEDVILYLTMRGANVIPKYEFLRANNNKSFMELMRKALNDQGINSLDSWSFGTLEEIKHAKHHFKYPLVIKQSAGAMSKGVYLAHSEKESIRAIKKVSRSRYLVHETKDSLRPIKHKGYLPESKYRNKFIVQEYIPDLINDWKVLVYYDKIFVLSRGIKSNDFRASGSKYNYRAGSKANVPEGLLDYAANISKIFNLPHISLDIVCSEGHYYLIEFQAVYFGTSTINMSDVYFTKTQTDWKPEKISDTVERYYVESCVSFLNSHRYIDDFA